jgi:hypothetical protein
MPFFLPRYFASGLKLTSEKTCDLKSDKNGVCIIQFDFPPENAVKYSLQYKLLKMESSSGCKEADLTSKIVFNSKTVDGYSFEIRFLEKGVYKFVTYYGPYQYSPLRLCEFKLVCCDLPEKQTVLPFECPLLGWDPGSYSHAAG